MHFAVSFKKVADILIAVSLGLSFISLLFNFHQHFVDRSIPLKLFHLFNVDGELNLPALYSALLLSLSSLLLTVIAVAEQQLRKRYFYHWYGLAIVLIHLSLDDWFQIHEAINTALQTEADKRWDILNSSLVAVLGLIYMKFFLRLPPLVR